MAVPMNPRPRERGNILFLILLAVVLFAALSYAVTQSMRGGGKDATPEQYRAKASQVLQYVTMVENTIQRLMMINNCSIAQISFENPVRGGYANAATPPDGRCKVFDAAGGGLHWENFTNALQIGSGTGTFDIGGGNEVVGAGTTCAATSCTDLVLIMSFPDEQPNSMAFCMAFNDVAGMTNTNGAPPYDEDISSGGKYTGAFAYSKTLGDDDANIAGHKTGCFQEGATGGGNDYRLYHVMYAR